MEENKDIQLEICSDVHIVDVADLNKKRKLQGEQLDLPSPKYKFRGRIFNSEHISLTSEDCKIQENPPIFAKELTGRKTGFVPEQSKSSGDSNSFVEESDTAISVNMEQKPRFYDQPSTSSGSFSSNNFKNSLYSLNSRASVKRRTDDRDEANFSSKIARNEPLTVNRESNFWSSMERALLNLDNQLAGFSESPNFVCSEDGNNGKEQHLDEITEEMIYSNDVTSNLYVLSSGRWSINQDSRLGARTPTIDQEFEQYFSMLML